MLCVGGEQSKHTVSLANPFPSKYDLRLHTIRGRTSGRSILTENLSTKAPILRRKRERMCVREFFLHDIGSVVAVINFTGGRAENKAVTQR